MAKSKEPNSLLTRLVRSLLLVGMILGTCFSPALAAAEVNVERYLNKNKTIKRAEEIIHRKPMKKFSLIMTIDKNQRRRGYIVWWDSSSSEPRFQQVTLSFLCNWINAWACPSGKR